MNMHSSGFVPADDVDAGVATGSQADRALWIDRYSISSKLKIVVLTSTLVMSLLAAGILGTMAYFGNAGETLRMLGLADAASGKAAIQLYQARDELSAYAQGGDAQDLVDSRVAAQGSLVFLEEILDDNVAALDPALVDDLNEATDANRAIVARLSANELDQSGARAIARDIDTMRGELLSATAGLHEYANAQGEPVFEGIRTSLAILVSLFVLFTVSSFFGSRFIANNVAGMINRMTAAMRDISQGDTDARIPGRGRNDEIGEIARALEVFRQGSLELRELEENRAREAELRLAEQQELAEQIRLVHHDKSRLLEEMANGFEISVGEVITAVSAASEQLKATSKHMVELADGSNEQANDATAAMKKATDNVTAAAAATDEFALSITEISRQAASSAELARGASDLVDSANTRMNDLAQAADEIGEIAGLIQTIAQRTNLLALNASIEAARGGEAGRGFAVVASEVKELAMQTSNATASVAEKIQAMQDSTRSSASDLTSIVAQIGELEQVAVMIATAVDQQSVSGDELARNIDTVASGSAQVGERLEALRLASEETGSAADDVVDSANALASHAEDLRTKAGRFIEDVRKSARDLEGEAA